MPPFPFTNINIATATDEEIERLKRATESELLRATATPDLFAVVESSRRLREALHKEEQAIKWLTVALVAFTVILVIMTAIMVWLGFETLYP